MPRPRVLLVSAEPLGDSMPGPAIRTLELGRALAPHADVVLAAPDDRPPAADLGLPVVTFHRADPRPLRPKLERATAVVAQPPWPHVAAELRGSGARLIFDLYDPEPFEVAEALGGRPPRLRRLVSALTFDRIAAALHDGHHFMCASEKQRDLWLGAMLAERLISPEAYDRDPAFASVIDVVPFGLPDVAPERAGAGPRGTVPGIEAGDEVVLWNGGIWNWLDAPTAIRAAGELAARRPRLRLLFMGTAARGQAARATEEARALASELGLLDRVVRFHDDWVPYAERGSWLLDADCAISTHADHLETRFAFRTRLLDCFWAGLPVVCTRGDELADRVERDGLGAAVPPGDHVAAAAALERVLDRGRDAYAPALERARAEFTWPRVAAPLVRWVTEPGPPPSRPGAPARPAARARDLGFRAALGAMRVAGVRRWPRV